jgi:hypothetical protein
VLTPNNARVVQGTQIEETKLSTQFTIPAQRKSLKLFNLATLPEKSQRVHSAPELPELFSFSNEHIVPDANIVDIKN